jgi:hypothetical protein
MVGGLLLEPPKQLPAELQKSLEEHEMRISRDRSRKAIYAYLSIVAIFPLVFLLEVKNWPPLLAFYGCVALGIAQTASNIKSGKPSIAVILVVNLAGTLLFSRVAGPFVLTPLIVAAALAGLTPIPWINERKWLIIGWAVTAATLPVFLEWLHVLPKTWSIKDGAMMINSDIFRTHGPLEEVLLTFVNAVFTLVVALFAASISHRRRVSQNALFIHAWHLRQLIPNARPWQTRNSAPPAGEIA